MQKDILAMYFGIIIACEVIFEIMLGYILSNQRNSLLRLIFFA